MHHIRGRRRHRRFRRRQPPLGQRAQDAISARPVVPRWAQHHLLHAAVRGIVDSARAWAAGPANSPSLRVACERHKGCSLRAELRGRHKGTACARRCEVHIYDAIGNYISKMNLYCLDDAAAATSLIGIDWYDGAEGLQDPGQGPRAERAGSHGGATTLPPPLAPCRPPRACPRPHGVAGAEARGGACTPYWTQRRGLMHTAGNRPWRLGWKTGGCS